MKLKWHFRILEAYNQEGVMRRILNNPIKSGNYWITDGNVSMLGFYKQNINKWYLYSYNAFGVISDLREVDSFNITSYAEYVIPPVPKKHRNDSG